MIGDRKLNTEPWIDLPDGAALKHWSRKDELVYNQQSRAQERARFFRLAFDYLADSGVVGAYAEFGCHRARTFRMALTEARRHNLDRMMFWACDSFAGPPKPSEHDDDPRWHPEALTTTEAEFTGIIKAHGIYTDRVRTMKGLYKDTLSPGGIAHGISNIAFANVDCDLYESARDALAFIDERLVPGAIVYIDDAVAGTKGDPNKGAYRAFGEYVTDTKRWNFLPHMTVGWWGKSFLAVPK